MGRTIYNPWYYNFSWSVREENYIVYICIRVKQKPLNRKYERDCCEIYRKLVFRANGIGGSAGLSDQGEVPDERD